LQTIQQVSIKNKVNLKELIAIEFIEGCQIQNDNILNYISKYYPNIEIKISKKRMILYLKKLNYNKFHKYYYLY
jgi:hypothetical protein